MTTNFCRFILIAVAGFMLTACDTASMARIMDPVIRSMADDEHLALFEQVQTALEDEDTGTLESMAGLPDGFAENLVESFPDEPVLDTNFAQWQVTTTFSNQRRSSALAMGAVLQFESGDYYLETYFGAEGDEPFSLEFVQLIPLFEEEAPRPAPDSEFVPV